MSPSKTPDIMPRSSWGARAPKVAAARVSWPSITIVDLHWPASGMAIGTEPRSVASALRAWQRFHMDSRGWNDIAYNVAVDLAGRVWMLRGWDVQDGGVSGLKTDVTVLSVLGTGERSTEAMRRSILWCFAEFERRKGGPLRRSWHGALSSTSCPGPELTAWGRAGFPAPAVIPEVPPRVSVPKIDGVKPREIDWRAPSKDFIKIVQEISGASTDGIRGPQTIAAVKRLQKRLGVTQDGHFGAGTAEAYLLSEPNMYRGRGGLPIGAVKLLQWIVRSRVDGAFGRLTEADVKSAQVWAGLEPDGNAGDETKRRITF